MSHARAPAWTVEHQVRYPLITEIALSPDGQQVVYALREPLISAERSEFITHLYLVPLAGGEPTQLTHGEHSNRCPRWSPDGRALAFLSTRSGVDNLHVADLSGGDAWALTDCCRAGVRTLEWSPDGQEIALLIPDHSLGVQAGEAKGRNDPVRWGADLGFCHVHCVPFGLRPRDLPPLRRITRGPFHVTGLDWFPDSRRLAITHRLSPSFNDWPGARLAIVPEGRQGLRAECGLEDLVDAGLIADWIANPRVSPDGSWIACPTGEQPPRWAMSNRITLYPTAGGGPRPLALTPDAKCYLLGWSPNEEEVYAFGASGTASQVWALPASGGPARALTGTSTYKGPLALSVSGQIAYVAQDFHRINAIYALDPVRGDGKSSHAGGLSAGPSQRQDEGYAQRWVAAPSLPDRWPEDPLPRAKVVRWQSSDGWEIEGIVVYPFDYEPGMPCPLVVELHGGPPKAFSRHSLASPNGYCGAVGLAEHGFVLFRPNPRGSSGYGRAFRFANYGDWGGGDYRDVMSGVDALVARGVVDPERMGIIGWSYGGYLASWTITQTDRFRAACVGAPMTNLVSYSGTTDIPSFVADYFGGEPWERPELYWQRSPIAHVARVRTPTLIQHGERDRRVPLGQSKELHRALKGLGVPVELVVYPRQGHSIADPRLRTDVRRRVVEWLERWVLQK